jgi:ATP adenylyltransferase
VVGEPDELERLWTPHRMAYISGDTRPADGYDSPSNCPFCQAPSLSDEDSLVVARGEVVYAVLNRFPYNPGHLLICTYRHVADYPELDDPETVELARFTQTAMRVIRTVSGPAGFNLGMNQGGVAGAGIAAHLHQHVVPRWSGDTNFMPVIGRTKTLPQLLGETRSLLADAWAAEQAIRRRARRPRPAPTPEPQPGRRTPRKSTVDKPATPARRRPA